MRTNKTRISSELWTQNTEAKLHRMARSQPKCGPLLLVEVGTVYFCSHSGPCLTYPSTVGEQPSTGSENASTVSTGTGGWKQAPANHLGGGIAVIDDHRMTSKTDHMEDQQEVAMEEEDQATSSLRTQLRWSTGHTHRMVSRLGRGGSALYCGASRGKQGADRVSDCSAHSQSEFPGACSVSGPIMGGPRVALRTLTVASSRE